MLFRVLLRSLLPSSFLLSPVQLLRPVEEQQQKRHRRREEDHIEHRGLSAGRDGEEYGKARIVLLRSRHPRISSGKGAAGGSKQLRDDQAAISRLYFPSYSAR